MEKIRILVKHPGSATRLITDQERFVDVSLYVYRIFQFFEIIISYVGQVLLIQTRHNVHGWIQIQKNFSGSEPKLFYRIK
jgi:hypothetical protein